MRNNIVHNVLRLLLSCTQRNLMGSPSELVIAIATNEKTENQNVIELALCACVFVFCFFIL